MTPRTDRPPRPDAERPPLDPPDDGMVRLMPRELASEVLAVLCDAFAEYPVMRYVLGRETAGYRERLAALIGFFLAARILRNDPVFGVAAPAGPPRTLGGVAVTTMPGAGPVAIELDAVREDTWAAVGEEARERYEEMGRAWERVAVEVPNLHLNMLAVRPPLQGTGLGRRLLEQVHAASRALPDSHGVTLTTEDPRNVPLYLNFGYRIVNHVRVNPRIETWGFFRPD